MSLDDFSFVLIVVVVDSRVVVLSPMLFLFLWLVVVSDHHGRRLNTDVHHVGVRKGLGLLLLLVRRPWRLLWTQSHVLLRAVIHLELQVVEMDDDSLLLSIWVEAIVKSLLEVCVSLVVSQQQVRSHAVVVSLGVPLHGIEQLGLGLR